jgi:hypothetical protein
MNVWYDSFGRPTQAKGRHGAYTYFSYTNGPASRTETTNGRWWRTTLDEFGRVVKVTEPAPGGGEWETLYSYNLAGRLT